MAIDKSAMLAEIRQFYQTTMPLRETMQPGDLTYQDIESGLNIGRELARKTMRQLIEKGQFTQHSVRDEHGVVRVVFRKVV